MNLLCKYKGSDWSDNRLGEWMQHLASLESGHSVRQQHNILLSCQSKGQQVCHGLAAWVFFRHCWSKFRLVVYMYSTVHMMFVKGELVLQSTRNLFVILVLSKGVSNQLYQWTVISVVHLSFWITWQLIKSKSCYVRRRTASLRPSDVLWSRGKGEGKGEKGWESECERKKRI